MRSSLRVCTLVLFIIESRASGCVLLLLYGSENWILAESLLKNPFDAMSISSNKHKLMYNIFTPSIVALYKFLWIYGGSVHIIYIPMAC